MIGEMHCLGQKINRVQTDGVRATVSLLLRSVKKSVTQRTETLEDAFRDYICIFGFVQHSIDRVVPPFSSV